MQKWGLHEIHELIPWHVGKGEGMRQILFVKYNRTRAAQFQLKTEIVREDEVLTVEKTALTEAGEAHIRSFGEKYEKIGRIFDTTRFSDEYCKYGEFTGTMVGITCADRVLHKKCADFDFFEYVADESRMVQ